MSRKYLIWSNEHEAWWGPNSRGYVRNPQVAGVYEEKEAFEIVRRASYGSVGGTPNEVLFPHEFLKDLVFPQQEIDS